MRRVFADTLYWVALTLPGDPWKIPADEAWARLSDVHLVTTDSVLTEFLAALAGAGNLYRERAALTVERVLQREDMTVLPQTREVFMEGLALYRKRLDKGYSLTDCISMNVCRAEGITEVLTNDHHFTQEGLTVLITR